MKNSQILPDSSKLRALQDDFDRYQKKHFPIRPSTFFALELCGEAGELANLEKKVWRDPKSAPSLKDHSFEAADVFISLLNYCNAKGIDLSQAVQEKLEIIDKKRLSGKMGETYE